MCESVPSLRHVVVARGAGQNDANLQRLIDRMPLDDARKRLADVPVGVSDVVSFQLSGGSTGLPKIIPRFHGEYLGHSLVLEPGLTVRPFALGDSRPTKFMHDRAAAASGRHPQDASLRIGMGDHPVFKRGLRMADAGRIVAHGCGSDARSLQQRQTGHARAIQSDAGIVEHHQQRA